MSKLKLIFLGISTLFYLVSCQENETTFPIVYFSKGLEVLYGSPGACEEYINEKNQKVKVICYSDTGRQKVYETVQYQYDEKGLVKSIKQTPYLVSSNGGDTLVYKKISDLVFKAEYRGNGEMSWEMHFDKKGRLVLALFDLNAIPTSLVEDSWVKIKYNDLGFEEAIVKYRYEESDIYLEKYFFKYDSVKINKYGHWSERKSYSFNKKLDEAFSESKMKGLGGKDSGEEFEFLVEPAPEDMSPFYRRNPI